MTLSHLSFQTSVFQCNIVYMRQCINGICTIFGALSVVLVKIKSNQKQLIRIGGALVLSWWSNLSLVMTIVQSITSI